MNQRNTEKLDVIFRLDRGTGREEMLGSTKVSPLLKAASIDDAHVLHLIIQVMQEFGLQHIEENGSKFSVSAYLLKVKNQGRWSRSFNSGGLSFRFGHVAAMEHSFVSVEETVAGAAQSWNRWVAPFLAEERFVQAWISSVEYDKWQNIRDPIQYEIEGISYAHKKLKSNGLPPPLEQREIDISDNPGRWILRSGYVEAIGSTMWLSSWFWKRVGVHRKEILFGTKNFELKEVVANVTQVIAAPSVFRDETTKDVQTILRAVLYG